MAKILLVEDDAEMAATISSWLATELYEVVLCADGSEGYERIKSSSYDLAILDWELPGISGLEICRRYRLSKGTVPVLLLTGRDAITDRVSGLDAGADDYLTKPFSLKELSARVRALLRRPVAMNSNLLEVGSLKLDIAKHRISKNGKEIQLMPRDFALLEFLMRNPDTVFSTDALLSRVWSDDSEAGPEALRTAIKRLRKKIDDGDAEDSSHIENIPRIGYRLRIQ